MIFLLNSFPLFIEMKSVQKCSMCILHVYVRVYMYLSSGINWWMSTNATMFQFTSWFQLSHFWLVVASSSFLLSPLYMSLIVFRSFLTVQYDFLTHLLCVFPAQGLDSAISSRSPFF